MYCTGCGSELREQDRYCFSCGSPTAFAPAPVARLLRLDKRNRKIAGVCSGFARYLEVDVVLVRVLWLCVALCTGGIGVFAYLAAWIAIPRDYEPAWIVQQPQIG